jgi:hypothetical protein
MLVVIWLLAKKVESVGERPLLFRQKAFIFVALKCFQN